MHFVRYINFKDWVAFCKIKTELKPFEIIKIFLILQIKANTYNERIFVNKICQKNIRYSIFLEFISKISIINRTKKK